MAPLQLPQSRETTILMVGLEQNSFHTRQPKKRNLFRHVCYCPFRDGQASQTRSVSEQPRDGSVKTKQSVKESCNTVPKYLQEAGQRKLPTIDDDARFASNHSMSRCQQTANYWQHLTDRKKKVYTS